MKRLLILAFACFVLFAGCKAKSEKQPESVQSDEIVEDFAETETSLEQEIDSVDIDNSQEIVAAESENNGNEQVLTFEDEIPQFKAVETLFYPETVELAIGEETELLRAQDFAISIAVKSEEEGKYSSYYNCDFYITDSAQNKTLLLNCDIYLIGEIENPISPYEFLNREKPLVTADINNNGIDDYLFVAKNSRSRDMIAVEKKDSVYKEILNWPVFINGDPDFDDIAESIIFNSGESEKEIIIDYRPYPRRSVLLFDEAAYEYKRDERPSYKMKAYVPKKPVEVKQFGTHELALSEDRIYFKNQDEYLKIYFDGDSESWGYYSCNADNIKIYDIDESSFIVQLNFEQKEFYGDNIPWKDQFYLIFFKDNHWCMNTTEESYINSYGIHHGDNETVKIQSTKKEDGAMKIYYSIGGKSAETVIDMDNPKYY
ncbi:MAG: hypothetical protein J5798_10150 [Spirochaetaceae bacterium]|nr:hypothetical protein [Spirochaetaceae bacterium]